MISVISSPTRLAGAASNGCMPELVAYQEAIEHLSVHNCGPVALAPFAQHHYVHAKDLAEHFRQSLKVHMFRGIYIAGGLVMCAATGVTLLRVYNGR